MAAAVTIHGLHQIRNKTNIDHTYFGSSQQPNKGKYQKNCVFCNLNHSSWDSVQFKQLDIRQRWDVAKSNKLCYGCLGRSHYGEFCTRIRKHGINGCKESHNCLYIEASLLEQTMRKLRRKVRHHPSQKGASKK